MNFKLFSKKWHDSNFPYRKSKNFPQEFRPVSLGIGSKFLTILKSFQILLAKNFGQQKDFPRNDTLR
jgi:hypothetical protein